NQSGSGFNLAQAISSGGHITFDCGGPATIAISSIPRIADNQIISIDGGGIITLDGGTSLFFGDKFRLALENISIQNVATNVPPGFVVAAGTVISAGAGSEVVLRQVVIRESFAPVVAFGDLVIENLEFSHIRGTGIQAEHSLTFSNSVFMDSRIP